MENRIKQSRKCVENVFLYDNSENESDDSADKNPSFVIESIKEKSNGMYIFL